MTDPLRRFEEWCRSPEAAELTARLDAEANAPGYVPREVAWLNPGPDPFGQDWAWVKPEGDATGAGSPPTEPSAVATPPRGRRILHYAAYAGGAALAASVLIAVGMFVGKQGNRGQEVAFAARVTAREDAARGAGVAEVVVENRSDSRAFITVIGLAPGKRPAVFSREAGKFIDIGPQGTRVVKNLPASFDDVATAVVVLTATPAGEAVQNALPVGATPDTADEVAAKLRSSLHELGFRGAAVEVTRLPNGGR